MSVTLLALEQRSFLIPDRFRYLFCDARRHARCRLNFAALILARRDANEFAESRAEGAQGREADFEADLGDALVAATQQHHCALDSASHQIAVRRFAVSELELATEVTCRNVRAARQRSYVQRLCVLAIDPISYTA